MPSVHVVEVAASSSIKQSFDPFFLSFARDFWMLSRNIGLDAQQCNACIKLVSVMTHEQVEKVFLV